MRGCINDRTFLSLAAAAAALFAADAYLTRQIHELASESNRLEWSVVSDLGSIRSQTLSANEAHHNGIEALAAQLEASQSQNATDTDQTKSETQEYARSMAQRVAEARRRLRAWADRELARIRAVAVTNDRDAKQLQTQVAQTREAAKAASADSSRARPDVSRLSANVESLAPQIAADREELSAMRAAAESIVLKFRITKYIQSTVIAGLTISLRKADPRTNRYSITIVSRDNQRLEANDRTLQEPVRLYTSSEHRDPIELVVNEIGRDEIAGFVQIPSSARVARDYSSGRSGTDAFPLP
jgi:chromosome segregation ATPase